MIKTDVAAILIKIVMTPQILPSELAMIICCIITSIKILRYKPYIRIVSSHEYYVWYVHDIVLYIIHSVYSSG